MYALPLQTRPSRRHHSIGSSRPGDPAQQHLRSTGPPGEHYYLTYLTSVTVTYGIPVPKQHRIYASRSVSEPPDLTVWFLRSRISWTGAYSANWELMKSYGLCIVLDSYVYSPFILDEI